MKRSFALLAFTLMFCFSCFAQNVDINILKNINPNDPSAGPWHTISSSVLPVNLALPAGLLALSLIKKDKDPAIKALHLTESFATAFILTQGLKWAVNRTRPYIAYPGLIHAYDASEAGQSFPSGHTAYAFSVATAISLECKKWYVVVPALGWASLVGYSRLYLGEHYPSDVLAGAVLGAGSAWLTHWANKKLLMRKHR